MISDRGWTRWLVCWMTCGALLAPAMAIAADGVGVSGDTAGVAAANSGGRSGTIKAAGSPTITSASSTTFTQSAPGSFTVTTTGDLPMAIFRKGQRPPAGVRFLDNGDRTGTLSGTPAPGTGGVYTFKFFARNGIKPDAKQNFTLNVNQAPVITSAAFTTCAVNVPCTFTVTTAGLPPPSIVRSGPALPAGMTFVDNGNGTGTLSGTPGGTTVGLYAFDFTATNGIGSPAVQHFSLRVNGFLTFTSAAATTCVVGSFCTFSVTAVGIPTPTVSLTGGTLPSGMAYVDNNNGTGTLSGIPGAGTSGRHALVFTAANGAEPDAVQDFLLTLNQAPAITSAISTSCAVNVLCSFTITTTGFPAPVIAQSGATLPALVDFVDYGDGTATISGIPSPGTAGTYALVLTASNGVGSTAVQNFTYTVNPLLAITSADNTTCVVGTACIFTVTTTGVPTPSIARSGVALPSGMSFADNGNGTGALSGTPAAATSGVYNLVFTAANGVETDAVQNFTLSVTQAPAITSANSKTCVIGIPCTFDVTTTGFPLPSIARTGNALPSALNFVDNGNGTGTLAGTAGTGTGGVYNLVFTALNGVGSNAVQNFTLTVASVGVPTAPLGVSALSGNGQATVSFSPPASTGGASIAGYTATCTPTVGAPVSLSGLASPITVPGLTNGTTYTCTVHATNSIGDGPESAPSNPVTPSAAVSAALTVSVGGSGTGTVTSVPAGITCPGTCSSTYAAGTGVVLTAAATGGSAFTGWLGNGCTGTSATCTVIVNTATAVSATFAAPTTLDIDLSAPGSKYDALTDGLLVIRYLFGLSGTAMTSGAVGPTALRFTPTAIGSYLDGIRPFLDVDGNGRVDALTDGLLILRYLFGLTGNALTNGAIGTGATRATAVDIESYLRALTP